MNLIVKCYRIYILENYLIMNLKYTSFS